MKYYVSFMLLSLISCGSSQRLFVDHDSPTVTTVGKNEVSAGIRSLVVERKNAGKRVFTMILDCSTQSVEKNPELTKVIWSANGDDYVKWIAVTDTLNTLKYFDTKISQSRVKSPLNFVKIENEELSLIMKLKINGPNDCLDVNWDSKKIIGFVQMNKSH